MSITSQPIGVIPVHIPLLYELFISIPTVAGETLKQVVITATRVSTGESFTFRQNFDTVTSGGGFTDGTATINLSAIAQTFFCVDIKLGAFGVLGGFYNNVNPLSIDDLEVSFTYDKVNTSGILEDIGVVDNAVDITLLNSVRDICDPQDLDAYVLAAVDRCFLTNRPEYTPICFGDNDFLQYWTEGINGFEVKIYEFIGAIPRVGVFTDSPTITTDTVASIGSGVININSVTTWIAASPVILPTDSYYTISAGFIDIGNNYTAVTKEQSFKLVPCCEDTKCTLFFLNRLGGVDRYSFDAFKQINDAPTSSFYEKARITAFNAKDDYGRQKYDSRDKTILTVGSRNICKEVSEWLRELQTSTRVYKQINDTECIAIVVRDGETIIENRAVPIITKTLTLEYAVDPCIQNNV